MNSTGHTIIYKDLVKVLDFEVNPEYHYGGMAMLSFKTHAFFVDQKMMPHLDFKELPEEIVEEDSEEEPEPIVESESEDEVNKYNLRWNNNLLFLACWTSSY
jgi:hypothetical protein